MMPMVTSLFSFAMPRYNSMNSIFGFTPNYMMPLFGNPFTAQFNFTPFYSNYRIPINYPVYNNYQPAVQPVNSNNNFLQVTTKRATNNSKTNRAVTRISSNNTETVTRTTTAGKKTQPKTSEMAVHTNNIQTAKSKVTTKQNKSTEIEKAIALAQSQIGVAEVNGTNNSAEINKYRGGSANGTPWCASFTSWCYGRGQNTTNNKTFGYSSSSQEIRQKAEAANVYSPKSSGYKPVAGDLMILRYADGTGHVGIIEKTNSDGTFDVIEGNMSDKVCRKKRSMSTENLHGFVRMNDWLKVA